MTFSPVHPICVPSLLPTRNEAKSEMFYETAEQAGCRQGRDFIVY